MRRSIAPRGNWWSCTTAARARTRMNSDFRDLLRIFNLSSGGVTHNDSRNRLHSRRKGPHREPRAMNEQAAKALAAELTDPVPEKPPRRARYRGKNPRHFHEKYKEHQPDRYPDDVAKVIAGGKTPAGTHRPVMVAEILRVLG